jgi:transposase
MTSPEPLAALIGIDWADAHHEVSLQASGSDRVERCRLEQTPEAIRAWAVELRARFAGQPVGIALETVRGPLVHALLDYDHLILYPVNPRSLQRFRETFAPSRAKDDPTDADLLRELMAKHRDRLRPWMPDDEATRALRRLVATRRGLVNMRTELVQQLTAALKEYFPQVLDWLGEDLGEPFGCEFLLRWPTLPAVQRARTQTLRQFYAVHHRRKGRFASHLKAIAQATPLTRDRAIVESSVLLVQALARQLQTLAPSIEQLEQDIAARFAVHEDAALFSSLPGSGAALAPRLLVAFGTDRTRFPQAAHIQQYAGIAPVLERSGRSQWVHWRWAAPTFVRQTFHEFAHRSIRWCPWARAYYALQRARGKAHHAALRALAFKWIRIIWRCWQSRVPYDDARYLQSLRRRGSPLLAYLPAPTTSPSA